MLSVVTEIVHVYILFVCIIYLGLNKKTRGVPVVFFQHGTLQSKESEK